MSGTSPLKSYTLAQRNVFNANNSTAQRIIAAGGYPFSFQNGFNFNAPNLAQCANPNVITCTARDFTALSYLNYKFSPLDNLVLPA